MQMNFIDKVHRVCESVIRGRRQHHESSLIGNQAAVYTFSSDPTSVMSDRWGLCLFAAVAFNSKARESNARGKTALPFDEGHYEESEVGGYGMKPLRILESGTLVAVVGGFGPCDRLRWRRIEQYWAGDASRAAFGVAFYKHGGCASTPDHLVGHL